MNNLRIPTIWQLQRRVAVLVLAMLIVPLPVAAQNLTPGFNIFSPKQDYEIGRKSALVANRRLPTYTDARVTRIGRRLASTAPGTRFPYEFRVVNDPSLNAFALPGGFIYVNRGALNAARSEDEIAGILAHEISHVALRHGTNQASKAYIAQAGLNFITGLLGGESQSRIAQVMGTIGGFGLNTLFLKYSRSAESEADLLAIQMMRRAGYNPYGLIQFLQTIQRHSGSRSVEFLSSHPNPENRIARLERELGFVPRRRR
jgi:beta-barrel assembly-enhancing protease